MPKESRIIWHSTVSRKLKLRKLLTRCPRPARSSARYREQPQAYAARSEIDICIELITVPSTACDDCVGRRNLARQKYTWLCRIMGMTSQKRFVPPAEAQCLPTGIKLTIHYSAAKGLSCALGCFSGNGGFATADSRACRQAPYHREQLTEGTKR